jgi:alpha-tubulin suppressor-like RCC1 family protein
MKGLSLFNLALALLFSPALPRQAAAAGTNLATGYFHSLFLDGNGGLWAMGYDGYGQLGDGAVDNITNRPEQIVSNGVVAVAAGQFHSLFLKSDGSLWAMGGNDHGQLGDGTLTDTNQPEQIVLQGVVAIATGQFHSLFLKSDGSLWAMGLNAYNQLGDGTAASTNRPEQVVASNVVNVAAGAFHSLFLKSDGSLWAMGANNYGQLGDGFTTPLNAALPEQIFPVPRPVLAMACSPYAPAGGGANLNFNATCQFGGTFYLLSSTNIAKPLDQWTTVVTTNILNRTNNLFAAKLTGAINSSGGRQFYILKSR